MQISFSTIILLAVACLATCTNAAAICCVTPANAKSVLLSALTSDLGVDFAVVFDKVYDDAIRTNSISTEQCVEKAILKEAISGNLTGLQENEIIIVLNNVDKVLDELYA